MRLRPRRPEQDRLRDLRLLLRARLEMMRSRICCELLLNNKKVLNDAEINDVLDYTLQISHRAPSSPEAAARGKALFTDKGNCFDCHAPDGTGNPDYGSTDLTANVWMYGGDREALFKSIRDGRHGKMDAFIGKLSFTQIRALAVEIYERSHGPQQVAAN